MQLILQELSISYNPQALLRLLGIYQRAGLIEHLFYVVNFCPLMTENGQPNIGFSDVSGLHSARSQHFLLDSKESAVDYAAQLTVNYIPELIDYLRENERPVVTRLRHLQERITTENPAPKKIIKWFNRWLDSRGYNEIYRVTFGPASFP